MAAVVDLPKQELLIKLMLLTTSDNDHEALNALRRANALLSSNAWDWRKLIEGKVKIIEDPFKNIGTPPQRDSSYGPGRSAAPAPPEPQQTYQPPPKPKPDNRAPPQPNGNWQNVGDAGAPGGGGWAGAQAAPGNAWSTPKPPPPSSKPTAPPGRRRRHPTVNPATGPAPDLSEL